MRDVEENLSQFKIEGAPVSEAGPADVDDLKKIQSATKIYEEDEMSALESTEESRASV